MSRSIDRCDGGFSRRQRNVEPVGGRFYVGLLNAFVIEAGVGAFIWLAICVT
jgi:hypothetical protein